MTDTIYILLLLICLVTFILVQALLKKYTVIRVICAVAMMIVVGAFANMTNFFNKEPLAYWGLREALTLLLFIGLLLFIVWVAIVAQNEQAQKIEATRQKTFYKDFRGTILQIGGEFVTLTGYPGMIFNNIPCTAGDLSVTLTGHEVVMTVDMDETKHYYRQSLKRFSNGSRPLPIVKFRNLTLFPET